jgi:hypothetical protein
MLGFGKEVEVLREYESDSCDKPRYININNILKRFNIFLIKAAVGYTQKKRFSLSRSESIFIDVHHAKT